ncbi:MAG: 2-C-methyl-D-erythritol 4-phosphate cytidylyltransferase [bacterium]
MSSSDTHPLTASAAVIVGGGSGSRFGGDKLTLVVAGKPLLAWSLLAFEQTPSISSIVVVAPSGSEEKFRDIAREAGISKLLDVIAGGAHRHESVAHGLRTLPPSIELVAIHDAARPLILPKLITRCLQAAALNGASAAAVPVTDTLHQSDQNQCAVRTVDRTGLWAMQTPQVFQLATLLKLLDEVTADKPTDEVSVMLSAGWQVPFVENLEPNMKITWPYDLAVAGAILQDRNR